MAQTHAAAHTLAHAAEHDAGSCTLETCDGLTGDDYREHAEQIERAAARRFAALDDEARTAYVRAARTFTETQALPEPGEDAALVYARYHGRLLSALGELLDLVGLAPEE